MGGSVGSVIGVGEGEGLGLGEKMMYVCVLCTTVGTRSGVDCVCSWSTDARMPIQPRLRFLS